MRKLILASAAAAAVLLTCLPVLSAEITGTVTALDVLSQPVVRGDGSVYALPRSV